MKKLLCIILALMLVATGVMLVVRDKKQEAANLYLVEISNEISALRAEKAEIEKQIEEEWIVYDTLTSGEDPCFVFLFNNMTANVMNIIVPLLEEYDFEGTVVLSDGLLPDDEGCITRSDYETLLSKGWDFAIGTGSLELDDDKPEVLDDYITAYKQRLTDNGYTIPITFYFNDDGYDEDYYEMLTGHGFKVICHHGEAGERFSAGINRDGTYLLGCGVLASSQGTMKATMGAAYSDMYTFGVATRYVDYIAESPDLDCDISKYDLMLRYTMQTCINAKVLTASKLYEHKTTTLFENPEFLAEFDAKISELEKSRDDIDARINELMK